VLACVLVFCSSRCDATALRHRPRKERGASRRCREHARRAMPNLAQRRSTRQRLLLWPWSGRSTWRQWIGGPRVLAGRGVGLHRHSRRIGLVGEDARQRGQQHHEAPPPSPSSDSAVVGGLARLVHVRLVAASWCRRSSRPRSAHQRLLGDARLTQSGRAGFGVAATRQKIGDRRVGAGRSEARQYASWVALAKQKAMVEAAVRAMQLHRLRPALGQGLEI